MYSNLILTLSKHTAHRHNNNSGAQIWNDGFSEKKLSNILLRMSVYSNNSLLPSWSAEWEINKAHIPASSVQQAFPKMVPISFSPAAVLTVPFDETFVTFSFRMSQVVEVTRE